MNKNALKKNVGDHVRFRPIAKEFTRDSGSRRPLRDVDWIIRSVDAGGTRADNENTKHRIVLSDDHIHHYTSDPLRGPHYGILTLNVQISIRGDDVSIDPTRPGEEISN